MISNSSKAFLQMMEDYGSDSDDDDDGGVSDGDDDDTNASGGGRVVPDSSPLSGECRRVV